MQTLINKQVTNLIHLHMKIHTHFKIFCHGNDIHYGDHTASCLLGCNLNVGFVWEKK